jgi:ABC-type multidrug transport system ATPase subunit
MKLDRRVSKYERQRRVEELLTELSLKKCEHTRIGVPGITTGISGGERKRLAFATEILTDP